MRKKGEGEGEVKLPGFNMEEREVSILKRYHAVTFITKTAPKLLNVSDKASLC